MYVKQTYFEFGDKTHTLLATQLRKRESDRTIYAVREDLLVNSPMDINSAFIHFYEQLYTSQIMVTPEIMQDFLDKCNLPILEPRENV